MTTVLKCNPEQENKAHFRDFSPLHVHEAEDHLGHITIHCRALKDRGEGPDMLRHIIAHVEAFTGVSSVKEAPAPAVKKTKTKNE